MSEMKLKPSEVTHWIMVYAGATAGRYSSRTVCQRYADDAIEDLRARLVVEPPPGGPYRAFPAEPPYGSAEVPSWLRDLAAAHAYDEPGHKPLQPLTTDYYDRLVAFGKAVLKRRESR